MLMTRVLLCHVLVTCSQIFTASYTEMMGQSQMRSNRNLLDIIYKQTKTRRYSNIEHQE